jgi:hypothetical protein
MPEAPFYVRVFAEQRGWTGGYQIALHRHRGESPQDSITLKPAVRQPYETPYFYPVNPDNVVWFDFRTAVSEHGQFPELKFILEYQSSYNLSFELLHADLTSLDSSTAWGVTGQHLERDDLPKGKYYLKVKLPVTGFMGKTFVMHWQTNLTYWIPMTLKCEVQDDTFGDDTIWYIVDVDRALPTRYRPLGDFDEDTLKGVFTEMGGPRAFLDHVAVWLLEEDHGLNFRHDRWGSQTVTTLPPTEREDWAKMVWKTSSYEYVLQALLLRDPEDLPASP